jgi:hypothetical protein
MPRTLRRRPLQSPWATPDKKWRSRTPAARKR